MTQTSARTNVSQTGATTLSHVFKDGSQRIFFEDGYIHYLHAGALASVDGLSIHGLKNAEIYFLAPLSGVQPCAPTLLLSDFAGLVNLVDCENVVISGLNARNVHTDAPDGIATVISCALNVSRSRNIVIGESQLYSDGKCLLNVHSGSKVLLSNVQLVGRYFELICSASEVIGQNLAFTQDNFEDSHSAIWVSSSSRHAQTNALYENSRVEIADAMFDMITGRAFLSGNGSYHTRSNVQLSKITRVNTLQPFGVCVFHENYHSIEVTTDFGEYADYLSTPDSGFAKFINYYPTPTRPSSNAPIIVDGFSSEAVVI